MAIFRIVFFAFVVALLFISTQMMVSVTASSPSEPAFKSQLRSCFESNRNTECLSSSSSWSSCGGSMFSSYGNAVSVSLNCMRSVCGNQNGLCCNTYCTMFGLSGYDRSICFNRCFNPNSGSVVATIASATTLMKTTRSSLDTNNDYVGPTSNVKDDATKVYCSISCDAEFAFYSTNGKKPSLLLPNVKIATKDESNTLAIKKKKSFIFSSMKSSSPSSRATSRSSSRATFRATSRSSRGASRSNNRSSIYRRVPAKLSQATLVRIIQSIKKQQINNELVFKKLINFTRYSLKYALRGVTDKKTRRYITRGYSYMSAASKQAYPQKFFAVYSNGKLSVSATAKLGSPALVKKRLVVFPTTLASVVPSKLSVNSFFNRKVKHNQICASNSSSKTTNIEYYQRSRINCRKIKSWISGATTISPKNLYQVNKFLFLVYGQCKKLGSTCVVPMIEGINTA